MSSAWDRELALERAGGEHELLGELVQIFREATPALLGEIRAGVGCGDTVQIERASHKLKGSLGALAATPAAHAALLLEQRGREGDLPGARTALEALEQELARLQPELDAFGLA